MVRITNAGDGEARNVRIEDLTLASGWEVYSEAIFGDRMPASLDVGTVGPAASGALFLRLLRTRGTADPKVTVKGSYTDAAGTVFRFWKGVGEGCWV